MEILNHFFELLTAVDYSLVTLAIVCSFTLIQLNILRLKSVYGLDQSIAHVLNHVFDAQRQTLMMSDKLWELEQGERDSLCILQQCIDDNLKSADYKPVQTRLLLICGCLPLFATVVSQVFSLPITHEFIDVYVIGNTLLMVSIHCLYTMYVNNVRSSLRTQQLNITTLGSDMLRTSTDA
jgi:uncharacterized membrane protein YqhA